MCFSQIIFLANLDIIYTVGMNSMCKLMVRNPPFFTSRKYRTTVDSVVVVSATGNEFRLCVKKLIEMMLVNTQGGNKYAL